MAGAKGRRWRCRSKPCSVCGRWFEPHPRVGKRQKTCGRESCQHELHQRLRRKWREEHPDYDQARRVRERIRPESPSIAGPSSQIDWQAAREVVGVQVAVVIEEAGQMVLRGAREVVRAQLHVIKGESRQMPSSSAREEMAARAPPP